MAVNQAAISASLATSLAAVNAALSAVPDLSTATPFVLAPIAAAVAAEIATLQSAIDAFDADIITTSVAGVTAGQPAPTQWAVLLNQVSDSQQIAALLNALGYLQRLATNLSQIIVAVPVFTPAPAPPPSDVHLGMKMEDFRNTYILDL
jgi:hypothetical protein